MGWESLSLWGLSVTYARSKCRSNQSQVRSDAYTCGMETPESRRRTGRLIHEARKNHQLSQRGLAREAGISETWLRALTVGLRGEDPQRAADDTWIALAEAVHIPPRTVFTEL